MRAWGSWVLLACLAAGCLSPAGPECADGTVCKGGQVCLPAGGCADEAQAAACEGKGEGAVCELPGGGARACRGGACVATACGDGVVDLGEACDDGNAVDDDACSNACAFPVCGDGIVQGNEACDAGAANGDDRACTSGCVVAACGDGLVRAGVEACDLAAANADTGACTLACTQNVCGDGKPWLAVEGCDDGNDVDDDGCRNDCSLPSCGDGVVQAGEGCDDGLGNGDDRGCTTSCQVNVCGDGKRNLGVEACDLGLENSDGGECTSACAAANCGDGLVWDQVEDCDDGAGNGDDRACTGSCEVNVCGDGKQHLGVEGCDEGADNADDGACTTTCAVAVCGDGALWGGVEVCDDGNASSGDGCRGDCGKVEACGDGAVDAGEACDDGADGLPNPADGCDACVATTWSTEVVLGRELRATEVGVAMPEGVAVDRAGNVYIADTGGHRIRRLQVDTGILTTLAGTGTGGFSGDGGGATSAQLLGPTGVAVDGLGNVYVADANNQRVRRIATGTGIITTVAGGGASVGNGGAATSAKLVSPTGVAVDGVGNVFIADAGDHRIRRIAAGTGVIDTVAGTGVAGSTGDGGLGTSATLRSPYGVAVDAAGDVYIADTGNHRIRKVAGFFRVITTVAGSGTSGSSGDGGAATSARFASPRAVAIGVGGDVYVADTQNHRVRRIAGGVVTRVAGTSVGFSGDGGLATDAALRLPVGVAVDVTGNLYVADGARQPGVSGVSNNRLRRVDAGTGVISTVAGTGATASVGDGGAATSATFTVATGVAVDSSGDLYVAAYERVRKVAAATGVITTIAGTGIQGFAGDGGPAVEAQINFAAGVAVDAAGNVYIPDVLNHRVRRVAAGTGIITTVAGTGAAGYSGDGGAATAAELNEPNGVAVDGAGNVYVSEYISSVVRRIDVATGTISTVAGGGASGLGDGGPATSAQLSNPASVATDAAGNLYIADAEHFRIRRVDAATQVITTVAGNGLEGFGGDGGPAVDAELYGPRGVAVDHAGHVYIADQDNGRIRRVDALTGVITTIAGTGAYVDEGDGAAAGAGTALLVNDVGVDGAGNVYVAASRVRRISAATGLITTVAGRIDPEGMGPAAQALLATPQALLVAGTDLLVAGGASGTVQALRGLSSALEAVVGRYPQDTPVGSRARFRDRTFGAVDGVAYDAARGVLYLSETTAHRLHAVTLVDPADEATWTIGVLAGYPFDTGLAGFANGAPLSARFDSPSGLYFDEGARVLYVADTGNHVVRALPISVAGVVGAVTTVAGTPRALGFFGDGGAATAALLYGPRAVTRCDNGDLFISDTANQRVRRVEEGSGVITTVLGDGVGSSSGQGAPAAAFPVDAPQALACDPYGNLLVTSRTAVRLLVADAGRVVDGSGAVQTIYGAAPRTEYPQSVTSCLTGLIVLDAETAQIADACTGVLAELWRQPVSP